MSSQQREWAELGQLLSQTKLEEHRNEIAVTFRQKAQKVARGEEITEADVRELYDCLDDAKLFIDEFATLVPGSKEPNFVDHMTPEERKRVAERMEEEGGL